MSEYRPKDGERFHVTLLVEAVAGGARFRVEDKPEPPTISSTHYLDIDGPAVVRVEPAPVELPTGFGARIRATVTRDGPPVPDVVLVRVANNTADLFVWSSGPVAVGGFRWHSDQELSDVVVLDAGEPS